MRTFYQILVNSLIAGVTTNFVWFALTYWAYLQTRSVLATSFSGGTFLIVTAVTSFWLGSIVDHRPKKTAMLISSLATLTAFGLGFIVYSLAPAETFSSIGNPVLWLLILILLLGVIAGNIRNIALSTTVTLLVPEDRRDKANGMIGSLMGIVFAITSVLSGVVLARWGMTAVLVSAIILTILAIFHLLTVPVAETKIIPTREDKPRRVDVKGTMGAIKAVPGLLALIFFTTFNNFLGGVFFALMDAYGLTLVSVEVWGLLWGFLSFGFIIGGLLIARFGLGRQPLRTLFLVNIILWIISATFTLQPWISLLAIGAFLWLCLVPFVEAIEQTIIQKVVPYERQGRVFGLAHSIEQAASPLTAFIIGPIAQFVFIPYMTTGAGVDLIGGWYGVGPGRGIALVFTMAGIIGLIVTLIAMRSRAYVLLSERYRK